MTPRVAILDYGCGNLASVSNAVRKVGGEPFIAGRWPPADEPQPTHLILPGQGHFGEAMENLREGCLRSVLPWARPPSIPTLGICLGMQLMCEGSEEAPGVKGLGWIPAHCERLPHSRLPHVGWNTVYPWGDFYFCHSYAAVAFGDVTGAELFWTDYEKWRFCVGYRKANLWATQFHPEKSGQAGLHLLAEFLKL